MILIAFSAVISGCGGAKTDKGPEAALEAFYKAVTAGDWTAVEAVCDEAAMEAYIEEYKTMWEKLQEEDGNALGIASTILEGMEIKTDRTERWEEGRMIYYTLEAGEFSKERKAYVKKEEGEWKVMEITDVI